MHPENNVNYRFQSQNNCSFEGKQMLLREHGH